MNETEFTVQALGFIRSELHSLEDAPKQGDEGGFEAWIDLRAEYADALLGVKVGNELLIFTWLHAANRDTLQVHPRDNVANPLTGVFATRSSHRPNPIGLHRVSVLAIAENGLKIAPIEAIDGTPVIDIKIALASPSER
jgi:tRNA-Thr(GGU) m(6)t(6)A37 methyltransferase TsaA